MKRMLLTLVPLLIACGLMFAVQPVRKPFIEMSVKGDKLLNGDILEVNKGDVIKLTLSLEGGRRDFAKSPKIYADIPRDAQITLQNENRLVYKIGEEKFEWKLLDQTLDVETDEKINPQINKTQLNEHQVLLKIPIQEIKKSFIKVSIKAEWQYTEGLLIMEETDKAEAFLNLIIRGENNQWHNSQNIKAAGKKDIRLKVKLDEIQQLYQLIEDKLTSRDFNAVQVEIRNLKNAIRQTDFLIDQIKNEDQTFFTEITFYGLPSDKPINDLNKLWELRNYWTELDPMLKLQQQNFKEIPVPASKANEKALLSIAHVFTNWDQTLPENSIEVLNTYMPEISWNKKVPIQNYISFNPKYSVIGNVPQAYADINQFLEARIQDVPAENQKINNTLVRLQAAKLFDGMLKGLFSSINFAKWENTRE